MLKTRNNAPCKRTQRIVIRHAECVFGVLLIFPLFLKPTQEAFRGRRHDIFIHYGSSIPRFINAHYVYPLRSRDPLIRIPLIPSSDKPCSVKKSRA